MLVEPARERQRTAVSKPLRQPKNRPGLQVLEHPRDGFDTDCSFVAARLNQLVENGRGPAQPACKKGDDSSDAL